ncbi:MAG TPA: hypothetical protein VHO90_09425, partial [Bacteroidales bacterium]|nr:hypothetical protein [Bacteroidales bacterium]
MDKLKVILLVLFSMSLFSGCDKQDSDEINSKESTLKSTSLFQNKFYAFYRANGTATVLVSGSPDGQDWSVNNQPLGNGAGTARGVDGC